MHSKAIAAILAPCPRCRGRDRLNWRLLVALERKDRELEEAHAAHQADLRAGRAVGPPTLRYVLRAWWRGAWGGD